MSTPVTFNGVVYSIPTFGDTGYAQGSGNLSSYLIALAGGPFPFTSQTANPATAGTIRLAKTDTIDWRNNANSANLPLGINGSDQLTYNGIVIGASGGVTSLNALSGALTLVAGTHVTVTPSGSNITIAAPNLPSLAGTPVALTGQTANITATSLFNPAPTGMYRVNIVLYCTTGDGAAGTVTPQILYADPNSDTQIQPGTGLSLVGTGGVASTTMTIAVLNNNNIRFDTVITGSYGTAVYSAYVTLEKLF